MTTETSKTERIEIEYPSMFTRVYRKKPASPVLGFEPYPLIDTPIVMENRELRYMFAACGICGKSIWTAGLNPVARGEDYMCDECAKEHAKVCSHCGGLFLFDHPTEQPHGKIVVDADGTHKPVCTRCLATAFARCTRCGNYHLDNLMKTATVDGIHHLLCPACHAHCATTHVRCYNCSAMVSHATAFVHRGNTFCADCWAKVVRESVTSTQRKPYKHISGYGHTPGTVFVSTVGGAVRFYGLEIEAENGIGDSEDQPRALLEELYPWIEFVLKEDGSISGFETVSVPLTLNYIRDHLRLHEWTQVMTKYGFKSDESNNAGLHVHISKAAFGDSARKRNKAIAAFLYLFQRPEFRTQLETFSRRRGNYRYCRFYPEYEVDYSNNTITRALPKALAYNKNNRNCMMNFHIYREGSYKINENTVELRLFKGSLRKSTIVATVELIDLFADIAIAPWTEESLRALTWADICNRVPASSASLKEYLNRRHIWEGN